MESATHIIICLIQWFILCSFVYITHYINNLKQYIYIFIFFCVIFFIWGDKHDDKNNCLCQIYLYLLPNNFIMISFVLTIFKDCGRLCFDGYEFILFYYIFIWWRQFPRLCTILYIITFSCILKIVNKLLRRVYSHLSALLAVTRVIDG